MQFKLKHPLKIFKVNQKFGSVSPHYTNVGLKGHNGIDFYALDSTPVYASHDGRVTFAGYDGGGGLGIVIRTEEEFDYADGRAFMKTVYWHLKTGSLMVTASQKVKAGQMIALADNTGFSTGAHLHFALKPIAPTEQEWEWENVHQTNGFKGAIDPMPYFETTPFKFTQLLKRGSKGEEVRQLQSVFLDITADGVFGPVTEVALKAFQKKYILSPDGIAGPQTRGVLNRLLLDI